MCDFVRKEGMSEHCSMFFFANCSMLGPWDLVRFRAVKVTVTLRADNKDPAIPAVCNNLTTVPFRRREKSRSKGLS